MNLNQDREQPSGQIRLLDKIVLSSGRFVEPTVVPVARPTRDSHTGAVTVLAGRNGTGKTFVLNRVARIFMRRDWNALGIATDGQCTIQLGPGGTVPSCHFLKLLPFSSVRSGKLESKRNQRNPQDSKTRIYRSAIAALMYSVLPKPPDIPFDVWMVDERLRSQYVSEKFDFHDYHLCNQDNPIVSAYQEAVGHSLYITRMKQTAQPKLDLALWFGDRVFLDFGRFSHGQQHLFISLLEVDYIRPGVLLIDEPETHLHPDFITHLLKFARGRCRQTICVTHHPHVIFSEFADQVLYFDGPILPSFAPPQLVEQTQSRYEPTGLSVLSIDRDFEKVSAAYDLFNKRDRRLLSLAGATKTELELSTYKYVLEALQPDVKAVSNSPIMDLQSRQLRDVLVEICASNNESDLSVLDFGAGLGRSYKELQKAQQTVAMERIQWLLWDPDPVNRAHLHEDFDTLPNCSVLTIIDDVRARKFDLAVLTNVVHHLHPMALAEVLSLVANRGQESAVHLLIIETTPLLTLERFAVAHDRLEIEQLLRKCGFAAQSGSMSIRSNIIQAYWVWGQRRPNGGSESAIAIGELCRDYWGVLGRRIAETYKDKSNVTGIPDYLEYLSALHSLASIHSYNCGIWK